MPAVLSKAIGAGGGSTSWTSQKRNVVRIFNLFIGQDEVFSTCAAGETWDALPEEELCARDVYERFAYYMLYVYEPDQRKGEEHLDGSTTRNYLAIAIHLACDQFKAVGSDATKRFFDCLDTNSTSEHAKWLRGVKANIVRAHCERADAAGKKLDKSESAPPSGSHLLLPAHRLPAHTSLSPCAPIAGSHLPLSLFPSLPVRADCRLTPPSLPARSAHLPADDEEGQLAPPPDRGRILKT